MCVCGAVCASAFRLWASAFHCLCYPLLIRHNNGAEWYYWMIFIVFNSHFLPACGFGGQSNTEPQKQKPKQSKQKLISFCYFWHRGPDCLEPAMDQQKLRHTYLLSGVRVRSWGAIISSLAVDRNRDHFRLFNNEENQSNWWPKYLLKCLAAKYLNMVLRNK